MNKWTCRTCDWILEVPSQGVRPEICPLCANDPERAQPNPGHHRWLSGPDAAEILIKGQALQGLYVERLDCDGAIFEHLVEISDCVVGEWSAREAMFTGGLEVSGTRFLNPIDFGAGHSEKIGRFAIGAHSEDTVKFIETQLDQGAKLGGCHIRGDFLAVGLRVQGQIDLSNIDIDGDTDLSRAQLDRVLIRSTRFRGRLVLERSNVARDFIANGMLVEDYIFADRGRFEGEFYVGEARLMKEVDMTKCLFGGNTTFDATEFESGLDLDSSEFMDALEFHKIELQGWADLERMSCNGPVVIERTNFHSGVDFQDSVFSGPLSIQDVHISGEAYFRRMRNAQRLNMINTRFEDCVDLRDLNIDYDAYFENVEFRSAVYISKSQFKANLRWDSVIVGDLVNAREMVASGSVHWIDCHLREDLILTGATLASEFDLTGSIVAGSLDLRRATFSGPAEFGSCQLDSAIRLEGINAGDFRISVDQVQHNLESEQTKEWAMAVREWEFLYQSLESRNQTREADIAFFKMRQMKNRASNTGIVGRFRALFERIFSEWGTGYGTRPINVFVFAVLSVFAFAALYRFVPGVSSVVSESGGPDQSVDFGDYLYFSLTTFTALAATFFSFGRLLVSTEAFVGGFLVALFTATLTRKIFRQ